MNLLTSGVMSGLIGASSNMKIADVSMSIYNQEIKKAHPDEGRLERSLRNASKSLNCAMKEKEKSAKELEKATIEANEKKKAEEEARLKELSKDKKNKNSETKVDTTKEHADTVEISVSGKDALENNQNKTQENTKTEDTGLEEQAKDSIPKIYSVDGQIKIISETTGSKISVKV